MNSAGDPQFHLERAQSYLQSAEETLPLKNHKLTIHAAQLALELAAKTIISYYHEPEWSHDPSKDLLNVIRIQGRKMEKRLGKATLREIRRLAADAKMYAPWHVWSTYGKREPGQKPLSPDALCAPEVVADLMPRARQAVALAKHFVEVFH